MKGMKFWLSITKLHKAKSCASKLCKVFASIRTRPGQRVLFHENLKTKVISVQNEKKKDLNRKKGQWYERKLFLK